MKSSVVFFLSSSAVAIKSVAAAEEEVVVDVTGISGVNEEVDDGRILSLSCNNLESSLDDAISVDPCDGKIDERSTGVTVDLIALHIFKSPRKSGGAAASNRCCTDISAAAAVDDDDEEVAKREEESE